MFLQQLVNGLTIGGIYAMIAVGYTMIYGVIQLINFAHGEIYMLGAFFAVTFISVLGLPFYAAFPLDPWKDAGIQKFRRLYYSISNYLSNYLATTNLPFLTILTKAGLKVSPFLSK